MPRSRFTNHSHAHSHPHLTVPQLVVPRTSFAEFCATSPRLEACLHNQTKRFMLERYSAMNAPIVSNLKPEQISAAAGNVRNLCNICNVREQISAAAGARPLPDRTREGRSRIAWT